MVTTLEYFSFIVKPRRCCVFNEVNHKGMCSYNKMKVQLVKPAECSTSNYGSDANYYQVNTAETKAESVFLSWITQPNGLVTCNTGHIKKHFRACLDFEDMETWKVFDIMQCADVGQRGSSDVFVTIGRKGESAEDIGKHLAATFTAFLGVETDNTNNFGDGDRFDIIQQGYTFGGVASNKTRLLPLLHYLSEENTILIFKAYCNTEEHFIIEDDVLIAFFGTADKGRNLLERGPEERSCA